jgi:hypothetical protein
MDRALDLLRYQLEHLVAQRATGCWDETDETTYCLLAAREVKLLAARWAKAAPDGHGSRRPSRVSVPA